MSSPPEVRRIRSAFAALWLVAPLLVPALAGATIVERFELPALCERADRILRGKVVRQEAKWDNRHERIYTDVLVQIEDTYKGARSETVLVRRLGGSVGDIAMKTIGEASFSDGEEVFLFLRRVPMGKEGEVFASVGLEQGKLHIERVAGTAYVRSQTQGASLMQRDATGRVVFVHAEPSQKPLADFEREVRTLVKQPR